MQVLAGSGVLFPLVAALPTAHGVGGFDIELVKGVGMLRLEGAPHKKGCLDLTTSCHESCRR